MSLAFNDTSTLKGLVQLYEDEIGVDREFISGNTERLKEFAREVNLAWDDYLAIALRASGRWQFDDSAHTDFPIIKTNIVQGQRDYSFTTDEGGNLVLDIYKVLILPSATATEYVEIRPIDQQAPYEGEDITSETTTQGIPQHYDKTGNTIVFDVPPSFAATNGLKVLINREPSYFTYSDTTKKPGCPGVHHRYFALKPALAYARRDVPSKVKNLEKEVFGFEGDERTAGSIARHFGRRDQDERFGLSVSPIRFR